ncbi:MAG: hypothetical protein BWY24_00589 [Microgenomates group bacterium ADurb.Bin219]|nr:MAG: hypothetical protein BWY24_00589 [Microgenomates group bacterium ADurb.Bin219]
MVKTKVKKESKEPKVLKREKLLGTLSASKSKEPQTMEELLSATGYQFKGLKKGEKVDGIITEITPKTLFIDIAGKTPGVVLGKEYQMIKGFVEAYLKPGDKVRAYVGNPETEKGQILLSLRDFIHDFAWNKYEEMLATGETTTVKGRELNKGGLITDTSFSLQGFIPGSQIGSIYRGKLEQLVGRTLTVKVIEVDKPKNRLVFSEKAISDAQKVAAVAKIIAKIKLGEIFEGEVSQIVPFGVFVKVGIGGETIEGLVHISEVSWLKVDDLSKSFKVGDKIKVKVVSTDDNRIQFSVKQLLEDPWDKLEEKHPLEKGMTGKVVKLASYGALVEIESGVEGLLHISKIPPEFQINEGDKVDVFIDSIDRKNRRISLGLTLKEKPLEYK